MTNSHGLDSSQLSQNYVRTEARLKARIVDGQADFQFSLWNRLTEGLVSTALPIPKKSHTYLPSKNISPVSIMLRLYKSSNC